MKILHITAHLGGGIGTGFAGKVVGGNEQQIIVLEKPENKALFDLVKANNLECFVCPDINTTKDLLTNTDVVVFNWWHHPKMAEFMSNFPKIPVRPVLRAHVSGNYYPAITKNFIRLFQKVIFSSEFSLKYADTPEKASTVYSVSDLESLVYVDYKKRTERFVIGYFGTQNFCKLNPNFVDFCAAVDIPNVMFAIASEITAKEEILRQAEKKGIAEKFKFFGKVANIADFLSELDAFAYLLNLNHYGTTENALLEALVAGVPTVALDQCVEKFIIKNNKTGLLVNNPSEFGESIRFIYENPEKAREFGENARIDILNRFSINENRSRFSNTLKECLQFEKVVPDFKAVLGDTPSEWFLSAVNSDRDCFTENRAYDAGLIFREKTKSSPIHFFSYFPYDKQLAEWSKQLLNHPIQGISDSGDAP